MGTCQRHVSLGTGLAMCMPRSNFDMAGPLPPHWGRVHCCCILWALTYLLVLVTHPIQAARVSIRCIVLAWGSLRSGKLVQSWRCACGEQWVPFCAACTEHAFPAAGHEHADYLVLDCNYWPGFEKTNNYAELMLQFLQDLASGRL